MTKIALIGYGKMGQAIERLVCSPRFEIVAIIDPKSEKATAPSINEEALKDAEVCIDFTTPKTVFANIKQLAKLEKTMVVGTTGFHQHFEETRTIVNRHNIGFLMASNFSLGVCLFRLIAAYSSQLLNAFENFDLDIVEEHDLHKKDSPSGTAIDLQQLIFEKMTRLNSSKDCAIESMRTEGVVGKHALHFKSQEDLIEVKHSALSRSSFAKGALLAAEWLSNKTGFYTLDDLIKFYLETYDPTQSTHSSYHSF